MSKIALPALYQSDTFNSAFRNRPHDRAPVSETAADISASAPGQKRANGFTPARASSFLVQMIVANGADLRRSLGRRDVAEHRELAYAGVDANRPSRNPGTALALNVSA